MMMLVETDAERKEIQAILQQVADQCNARVGKPIFKVEGTGIQVPTSTCAAMIEIQEHALYGRRFRYWAQPDFLRYQSKKHGHPIDAMVDSICAEYTPQEIARMEAYLAWQAEVAAKQATFNKLMSERPEFKYIFGSYRPSWGDAVELGIQLQVNMQDLDNVLLLLAPIVAWLHAHNYVRSQNPRDMRWVGNIVLRPPDAAASKPSGV